MAAEKAIGVEAAVVAVLTEPTRRPFLEDNIVLLTGFAKCFVKHCIVASHGALMHS